jgi:hypothetical protein
LKTIKQTISILQKYEENRGIESLARNDAAAFRTTT